jgi:type II secretory pathway component GspD/PulD (secretin)
MKKIVVLGLVGLMSVLSGTLSALAIKDIKMQERKGVLVMDVQTDAPAKVIIETQKTKWVIKVSGAVLEQTQEIKVGLGQVVRVRPGQHGKDAWLVVDLSSSLKKTKPVNKEGGFEVSLGRVDTTPAAKTEKPGTPKTTEAETPFETKGLDPAQMGLTHRLVDVSVQSTDERTQVVLSLDGQAKYRSSYIDDGKRLVISLINTSLTWAGKEISENPAVESVKAFPVAKAGQSLVNIEILLKPGANAAINRDQNQIVVALENPEPVEAATPKKGNIETIISLDLQSAEMRGTLKALCEQAGFEVFMMPSIGYDFITMRIDKQPLNRVLSDILGIKDLRYDIQGNIIYLGTQQEIVKQKSLLPKVNRYYSPRSYERAVFMDKLKLELKALDSMLEQSFVINNDPDSSSEDVVFTATKEDMGKLMAVVARLDEGARVEEGADEEVETGGGRKKTQVFYLKYVSPSQLRAHVEQVLKPGGTGDLQGTISEEARTRSFVITASPKYLKKVRQILERLDIQRPQVSIEAKIVEVNASDTSELGVDWTAASSQANADPSITANVAAGTGAVGSLVVRTLQSGFNIQAAITALVNQQKANILSSPRITTQDDQAATISTTDVIPYLTSETLVVGNTISSSPKWAQTTVPLNLNVTPKINTEDNDIRMEVKFDVASVSGQSSPNAPPPISTQSASTSVKVKNGETAVIGGLIRDRLTETENKVPILGDIPLLGLLFKSRSVTVQKKELIILLTPTIVED